MTTTSLGNFQDWCYTESGKWGNCDSDCEGGVPGCFKANVKYSPIDDFPGAQRSVETSGEACRARCALDSQCAYFSFWEKELPDDNGCTLFGSAATFGRENETVLYITGPATCPGKLFSASSHDCNSSYHSVCQNLKKDDIVIMEMSLYHL